VTAGCAGILPGDGSSADPTEPGVSYPDPPDTLTNTSARERVIEYEAAHLESRLREEKAITDFEMGYAEPANATVRNRSDGGLYVSLDASYSYGTENSTADFIPTCSLYHVNETAIRRVSERDCDR